MYSTFLRLFLASRTRAIVTILLWFVATGVLGSVAPSLKSVQDNAGANLPPAASESMRARDITRQAFPDQTATPAIIVVRGKSGDKTQAAAQAAQAAQRIGTALSGPGRPAPVTGAVSSATPGLSPAALQGLVSKDGTTQLVLVPVVGNSSDEPFRAALDKVRDVAAAQGGTTCEVAVTGPAGIMTDAVKVFAEGDLVLLFSTIGLVLIILLVIYRSPLMALLPLLSAGIAMRLAQAIGALLADAGVIVISSQTASIMTVLLFGVGTDYALIITARYREALIGETDRYKAMISAMRGVGETVLSSASTVILAMLALLVAASPALHDFGPYLALGVAVMALVAFSFIPAMALLFGRAVFWPTGLEKAAKRAEGGRVWHRIADLVTESPVKVSAAVITLLAVMSLGLIGYQQSFDLVSGFRVDTQSERGNAMIAESFGPGEVAPTSVLVTTGTTGSSTTAGTGDGKLDPAAVARVGASLAKADGVVRVGAQPRLSSDGRTALYQVVLDQYPYNEQALDEMAPLRKEARAAVKAAGLSRAEVAVGGETAKTADTRTALNDDMKTIIVIVLLLVGAVLALLLRSLLAPVYLVATLLLSFAATMGVTTFFTLTVWGDAGIGNRVAAYVFIFLVALGVDYNIFIMSRFRQETLTKPVTEAMRAAVTRTGGVVSSAGLILAATFLALATQPIRELFQFGLAMAFGILLDTFLIRPLLVPAIVELLKDKALWPARPKVPSS